MVAAVSRRVALLSALATAANARVFKGSLSGASSPTYVGKFAFGVDPTGGPVGTASVVYSEPQSQTSNVFASYNDIAWGNVYKDGGFTTDCNTSVRGADVMYPMPPNQPSTVVTYAENSRAY